VAQIDCIPALKALGEVNRLRIIRLLMKQRAGVNEISKQLRLSQYNVSKHLRILKAAGLVEMQRRGKLHLYSVVPRLKAQLKAKANTLDLVCCTFHFDKLAD